MAIKRQSGFTLIELIIVMTISASLAVIALMGFSSLRSQTQFSDSVERLRESVVQRRTEANGTVSLSTGVDSTRITFGRIMTFTPGSGIVKIQTLSTDSTQSPVPTQVVTATATNALDYTIAWSVLYNGVQNGGSTTSTIKQIAFVRSPIDGSLHTAVSSNGGWSGLMSGNYSYQDFIGLSVPPSTSLSVTDGTRQAWIDIDPTLNSVSRRFK